MLWNYWSLLAVAQRFCMYENYKVFVFVCDSGYLRKVEWICSHYSPQFCKFISDWTLSSWGYFRDVGAW
jgi:hypothetical protein